MSDYPIYLGHGLFDAFGPLPEWLHDGGSLDFGPARESALASVNDMWLFADARYDTGPDMATRRRLAGVEDHP